MQQLRAESINSSAFTLKYTSGFKKLAGPRIVISSKIAPKAVDRNRMKRRIKEILRAEKKNQASFIIYVKKIALDMSFFQLQSEFKKIFEK